MTQRFREIQPYDLSAALESVLFPRLRDLLRSRGEGHCMRVTDLDSDLMARLCGRLRAEVPNSEVVILGDGRDPATPPDLTVTSTKLVELRNPLPDGTQRAPLLVFTPSDLRVAAEDSFGAATFEQVHLGDTYGELSARLLQDMPTPLRGAVAQALARLTDSQRPWPFADPVAVTRFLLTAAVNDNDAEAIGAALYELALIPDFELLAQPEKAPARIARNRECVQTLTWSGKSERGRVHDLGLANRAFRLQLSVFVADAGLEDPRAWTRRIVLDRSFWGLAFNKWEFEDSGEELDSIFIFDVETNLPVVGDDDPDERLRQLAGQRVLPIGKDGVRKFNVTFQVERPPSKVRGLATFSVQVVSKEHGPVGLARGKRAWTTNRTEANVSFTKVNKVAWEEGWHFIRVLAKTADDELVPLVDAHGNPIPWTTAGNDFVPRPNESDLFYVLPEGQTIDYEPPQRALQREDSLVHARTRLQFSALLDNRDPDNVAVASVAWAERKATARPTGSEMLEVGFAREGTMNVPVSRTLKILEQRILSAADGPISWRVPINPSGAGQVTGQAARWPNSEAAIRFLAARGEYFEAIRAGVQELVTQAADLRSLQPLVTEYADAYRSLVQDLIRRAETGAPDTTQHALADLRNVLAVDTITLAVQDHRGRWREAAIVAPTHPLRALWFTAWAGLAHQWLQRAKSAPREFTVATRDALLRSLTPVSFPPVLPTADGRVLTAVDNLHPFWTLYAPSHEEEPRSLVGEVCGALTLPEPALGGASIDGDYLASRVERYLVQHPYVRTLVINAFNAGRARILADMLLELQKQTAFAGVRYDIRLFTPDVDSPDVGDALGELLSLAADVTASEADAFSTPSETHLRPKLALAVHSTSEFRRSPGAYAAHLSLLFDLFPAEEVGAARASREEATSPVHGLVQEFQVEYCEDESAVTWSRQPRHGLAAPLDGAEELTDLLSTLSSLLSSATATVSTGQAGLSLLPVVTLALGAEDRGILHQVHEVSDWVFTLDRNMGIEFFDHGGVTGRPDYLIDHSPVLEGGGHQLVITSRSVTELESLLTPALEQHGLKAEGRHAVAILDQLRSLSGRLALKLISSPSQRAEALGLALSRMYLEHQGVFSNQVVVPLDAHLDLYGALKRSADELGDEVSLRRTDLALFDLDAGSRTITCRLVEVKCYRQVGDIGAYNQLKNSIAEQIAHSENVISHHFDPGRWPIDRPDRPIKTRQLALLLEFYLDRAVRYRAIAEQAAEEARFFLRTLDDGYRLDFTRAALIFDFDKPGTEPAEHESGIEYHRVGVDLIQQLVDASAPVSSDDDRAEPGVAEDDMPTAARSMARITRLRELASSIPTLDQAAFLGRDRDRSVSWDDLRTKRTLGEQDTTRPSKAPETVAGPGDTGALPDRDVPETHLDAQQPRQEMAAAGMESSAEASEPESPAPVRLDALNAMNAPTPAEPMPELSEPSTRSLKPDVILGVSGDSPQHGILGDTSGRTVAIDLNQTHTISLFGVQGGGKSYTLGAVAEMASLPIPNINRLPQPLATVIFHYSPTMEYKPEFTSMVAPNTDEAQIKMLRERYGAEPKALADVLLLVPADKLDERREEYPGIEVHPLKFAAAELQASHWRFLMGAVGNQATYMRQLNQIMKRMRSNLTLDNLRQAVDGSVLPDHLKDLARLRLDLAAAYIDDSVHLSDLIHPGRLIIVDLRDEFLEKDEALGLFVVLLQLFADAKHDGNAFNKLVVFDEAHKYIESPDLVAGLVEVVREMRHKGTNIMVASQDPPSVPVSLIELSSQIILHKFNSPAWLKHLQKANAALAGLTPDKMAHLRPGEAYVWSSKATDDAFTTGAIKVHCRPRVTQHGGATKTAIRA